MGQYWVNMGSRLAHAYRAWGVFFIRMQKSVSDTMRLPKIKKIESGNFPREFSPDSAYFSS
jgi:hypothetical protein